MAEVNQRYEGTTWPAAAPQYVRANTVVVPNVQGFDPETAKVQLVSADLSVQIIEQEIASPVAAGMVAKTEVAAGEIVPRGSIIKVYISRGGQRVVPDVTGLDMDDAFATLEGAGFIPSYPQPSQTWLLNKCDPFLPNEKVHSTEPAAGSAVIDSSAIIVMPNQCG